MIIGNFLYIHIYIYIYWEEAMFNAGGVEVDSIDSILKLE